MNNFVLFIKSKKAIYLGIALVVLFGLGYFFFFRDNTPEQTMAVVKGEFLQQVSVSGKVVSTQNLDLSFEQAGMVKSVSVKVGDKILAGKLLASQDVSQLYTQYSEMQAGIDVQKARLAQLLAGASAQDIAVSENAVISAEQDLTDSYQDAVIELKPAYDAIYNSYALALDIQNTYFSDNDQQGIKVQDSRNAILQARNSAKIQLDGAIAAGDQSDISNALLALYDLVNTTYKQLSVIRDQASQGVYYNRVSAADKALLDGKKGELNTSLSSLISAKQAIASYQLGVTAAQNALDLKKATARPTDIAVFQAQINQAQSSLQNVSAQIRKRQIYSPIGGVITDVPAKIGSILSGGAVAVSLISSEKFQIESYVPEIYISQVGVGNEAEVTFDAYGAEKIFMAKVISIDPAETVKDGVANYKINLQLDYSGDEIKNGMTSNVIITIAKKSDVISIPQGIVKNQNGKKTVTVKKGEESVVKEVTTGNISLSGQIEILSGLSEGDSIIVQ